MRDSYVPNFKVPSQKKPSGKMWVTIVLCVALPPLGMILLWGKTRCPLRGKVLMTLVSVAVMVVVISLVLQYGVNANARRGIYDTVEPTPIATVVPAEPTASLAPAPPQEDGLPVDNENGVIPANPAA